MTLATTSKIARRQQQGAAARKTYLGDPLRLPFARTLQGAQHLRISEAYRILVTTAACSLTLGQQEELYLATIRGLDPADLNIIVAAFHQLVIDMEDRPYTDLLGPLYMEIGNRFDKQTSGEFFTPQSVSRLMARMTLGPDALATFPEDGPLECSEPACGTGGMVLAMAQALSEQGVSSLHTRWTVQDLSSTSCYAAYVNLTLWGVPARVVCGNTLTTDVRWTWTNPFWNQARPLPVRAASARARQAHETRLIGLVRHFLAGTEPTESKEVV